MNTGLMDGTMSQIADEINSIKIEGEDGTDGGTVGYEPKAWNREGLVD